MSEIVGLTAYSGSFTAVISRSQFLLINRGFDTITPFDVSRHREI
jgi:hypothetical protein